MEEDTHPLLMEGEDMVTYLLDLDTRLKLRDILGEEVIHTPFNLR